MAPTSEWLFVAGLPRRNPKLSQFALPRLCEFITLCLDLQLGWNLKQIYSSPWELSKGVLHSTFTYQGWVDSRLLMVGSQIANLTPDLSFCHNLCCKCPNGSSEPIFDIYTSIYFQWYKERLKARFFDPCNQILKFQKSWRTHESPFQERECHPHTLPKVGFATIKWSNSLQQIGFFYVALNTLGYFTLGHFKLFYLGLF